MDLTPAAVFTLVLFSLAALVGAAALFAILFRIVVPTNETHIVQAAGSTVSYGKVGDNGNVYYRIPGWVPRFGISVSKLPISNFDVDLKEYEAFDDGRLPFLVDVKAFFRIQDPSLAAARVATFEELHEQLTAVVKGTVRTVLASKSLEQIMGERKVIGDLFTKEVELSIAAWGVENVRHIELMDIKDDHKLKSIVIHNIMEKKRSEIEKDSRIAVAKNEQESQVAEINSQRQIELQKQDKLQTVGLRTVESEKAQNLADEKRKQEVAEASRITAEKDMAVKMVKDTKAAEIAKQVALTLADQNKQQVILAAEAELEQQIKEAEATRAVGEAKAAAEKAMKLAPIQANIELAKEIGKNKEYQEYLLGVEQIKASQAVGIAQADAIGKADVKIIANSGDVAGGVKSLGELLSAKGGTQVGAFLEGLKNTPAGEKLTQLMQ